jgi:hypothetical protein
MNRDDIIRMAREAGFEVMDEGKHHYAHITDTLCHIDVAVERFATLVAAAEREECAKVCDRWAINRYDTNLLSAAIRARGQQ